MSSVVKKKFKLITEVIEETPSITTNNDNIIEIPLIVHPQNQAYSLLKNGGFSSLQVLEASDYETKSTIYEDGRTYVRPGSTLSYFRNEEFKNSSQEQQTRFSRRVYRGFYEDDIPVAVQKIDRNGIPRNQISREFHLRQLNHDNLIRYYALDEYNDFVYIGTELCLFSVEHLINSKKKNEEIEKIKASKLLTSKMILYQTTRGLDYLHGQKYLHRNIKPSSCLIKKINDRYVIKLSDFRLSRYLHPSADRTNTSSIASEGWIAPESTKEGDLLTLKLDVFLLGCLYYYVLSKGQHPFGSKLHRKSNILNPQYEVHLQVSDGTWNPPEYQYNAHDEDSADALDLIKRMMQIDPEKRIDASQILSDKYFKTDRNIYYSLYESGLVPGLCLIFNQINFQNGLIREGSEIDESSLLVTFKNLGFHVRIYQDLTSLKLKEKIHEYAKEKDLFSRYASVVVCLLSHGDEGVIYGSDRLPVNINELKYQFSSNNCPDLFGKPKIFIIQACQGQLLQQPDGIHSSDPSQIDEPMNEQIVQPSIADQPKGVQSDQPPLMDFLAIKSTPPGFQSIRNPNTGTFFIQTLCSKLQDEYLNNPGMDEDKQHLEELLRGDDGVQQRMNELIKNEKLYVKDNKGIDHEIEFRQTIQWEASLDKFIRFKKLS